MRLVFYISVFIIIIFGSCKKDDLSSSMNNTIYVKSGDQTIPAYIHGNGLSKTFIVLLHGGPGGNGLEYRSGKYSELLEQKYAVVYTDQRGQGMTQGHGDKNELSIGKMSEDVSILINILKKRYGSDVEIFLFGHSWGGTLGTNFMLNKNYENLVNGWIEASGAHDIPKLNKYAIELFINTANEQIDLGNSVEKWEEIKTWASAIDTNNISIEQSGEINTKAHEMESTLENDGILNPRSFPTLFKNTPTNGSSSYFSGLATSNLLLNEIEASEYTSQLHKITKPCLFLYGKYDFVTPYKLGRDAFNNVSSKNKKLVIFEKSGHSPMDNEPEEFVNEIITFIDSI